MTQGPVRGPVRPSTIARLEGVPENWTVSGEEFLSRPKWLKIGSHNDLLDSWIIGRHRNYRSREYTHVSTYLREVWKLHSRICLGVLVFRCHGEAWNFHCAKVQWFSFQTSYYKLLFYDPMVPFGSVNELLKMSYFRGLFQICAWPESLDTAHDHTTWMTTHLKYFGPF